MYVYVHTDSYLSMLSSWELSFGQIRNVASDRCLTFLGINQPVVVLPCAYDPKQMFYFSKQFARKEA